MKFLFRVSGSIFFILNVISILQGHNDQSLFISAMLCVIYAKLL